MAAGLAGVTEARVLWSLKQVRNRGIMLEVCGTTLYVVRWTGVYVLLPLDCSTIHIVIHITTCSHSHHLHMLGTQAGVCWWHAWAPYSSWLHSHSWFRACP
jgi:hypothetical protein